ncbi:hypothetical protein AB7A01_001189 [Campylobacter coli]|uniref:hypothetical protein n=1 Tax=Campylobacter TaxID=194 RepID=UPI00069AA91E|nr:MULTISPECIES: hypothetical protein [Campylobacter]EAC2133054.1 hypothetical protein [Campylobacter coli]EAH7881507.1 hypothetical protein [Campylobacter coli]EAH7883887.1 hypothetical protein [Campylobacter coli]EAH7893474.1 hypothetical protein [Campylobacter coli]EAH7899651.1 hypothetical protein [Campylobacter coli]
MSTENKIDLVISRLKSYELDVINKGIVGLSSQYSITGTLNNKEIKAIVNHFTNGTINVQGIDQQLVYELIKDIIS